MVGVGGVPGGEDDAETRAHPHEVGGSVVPGPVHHGDGVVHAQVHRQRHQRLQVQEHEQDAPTDQPTLRQKLDFAISATVSISYFVCLLNVFSPSYQNRAMYRNN